VGTAAKRHQHFDGLDEPGKTIAFPRPGADRTFLFTEVGITHVSPLDYLPVRAEKQHPRNGPWVAGDDHQKSDYNTPGHFPLPAGKQPGRYEHQQPRPLVDDLRNEDRGHLDRVEKADTRTDQDRCPQRPEDCPAGPYNQAMDEQHVDDDSPLLCARCGTELTLGKGNV
jgi:hypothetical protein